MTAPLLQQPVPRDFNTLTLQQVKELRPSMGDAEKNRPYIEGDHLQGGDRWKGPQAAPGGSDYTEFLKRLQRVFVSKNVIFEVSDRLQSAVVGREPRWYWAPKRVVTKKKPITDAETEAIAELESALTEWWDEKEAHKLIKRLMFRTIWAQQCVARLYVPSGLTKNGVISETEFSAALKKIFLDIPEPEDGFVYIHPDTNARLGVVFFRDGENKERAEITFLNDTGQTVIKLLPDTASGKNDFGENLPIMQSMVDWTLITEQIRQLQDALNVTLTLLLKGLNDNYFLERLFIDILAPGAWTYTSDGAGGQVRDKYVPDPKGRATGGAVDSFLQSVDYTDEDNKTVLAQGKVQFKDPLDPTGGIKVADFWYQCLLEASRQSHILLNTASTPTGRSREEARVDFADSGKDVELQAELIGRQLLTTVVAMAETFSGQKGKWTSKFKPVFKCNARYGKLTPEERMQNINEVKEGLMAETTAMQLNGIDDVDAEKSIIALQPSAELTYSERLAEVVNLWATEFPRQVALLLAGIPEDRIKVIMAAVGKAGSEEDPMADRPKPVSQLPKPAPAPNGTKKPAPAGR